MPKEQAPDHLEFTETEQALDRLNQVLRARHHLMVDEVRKVAAAIHELIKMRSHRRGKRRTRSNWSE